MPAVKIPVAVWEDDQGLVTATTLEGHRDGELVAAVDVTQSGALGQLKTYFEWSARSREGAVASDFLEPVLFHVRVQVRPEYRTDKHGRPYPCEHTVELNLPCIRGRTLGGILCCTVPTLGLGFYCYDSAALRGTVVERVRSALEGRAPNQIAPLLPPKAVRLDQIIVRIPSARRRAADSRELPPTLDQVARPVGAAEFRKAYSAAYEREAEVTQLAERLRARTGSILLIGEDGVGKTTLLVNAVRAIERERGARDDENAAERPRHRFWHTTGSRLIAGMQYLGQWQERCEQVVGELAEIDGVLCVDSLADLVRQGGSDPRAGIAAFFLPYLESGQLRLVAEATPAELEACRRLLPGLLEVLQFVRVDELLPSKARSAVNRAASIMAQDSHLEIDQPAADAVVRLFRRFVPYRPLPGAGTAFLRRLFNRKVQRREGRVGVESVVVQFVRETGLPEMFLDDSLPLELDAVCRELQKQVIGQEDACLAVARIISTFKAGLNDPRRPLGSLLFCGPTGVGKTQLAKTLSDYLFGHGDVSNRLVRLDMSEYSAPWAAERLITKPDGTPSDFVSRVRGRPFVVVLLDEIEKACPEVFDMLLGLLDEGRLTDRYGRTTWFRTAVVIMTSNLGSARGQSIGFSDASLDSYQREVRDFFRPEFFNRLDGLVTFRPLGREVCLAIVRKELGDLGRREGIAGRGLELQFAGPLVERLVEEGFDVRYGARPLQRTIEHRVVGPLSRYLAADPAVRNRTVVLDLAPGEDENRAVVVKVL
ncbi:MAG: ATP-dependent Clp protease ATP-binding subunit [Pirellulales bacterium]|nr:ATP-dependent Clp protease ATP-binding subunit [Pirellulales bacterium]